MSQGLLESLIFSFDLTGLDLELEWDDHETCTDLLIDSVFSPRNSTKEQSFFENPMTPNELMKILREITLCKFI